jgi:hypothetical protein
LWNAAKIPFSRPASAQNGCLKFKQTFEKSKDWNMQMSTVRILPQNATIPGEAPLFARFLAKLVLDVLPAALASVIGGFLFTQFHFFSHAVAPQMVAVQPASAEMMAMVRDEHTLIMNYLQAQAAAEQKRDSTEDAATARAVSTAKAVEKSADDAKLTSAFAATDAAQPNATPPAVAKAAPAHANKAAVAHPALPQAPLLIAQAEPIASADAPADDRLARDPNSLLAKTLDVKDHVVAATRHVVSAIGSVFGSVTDTIGAVLPGGRQFSSES